MIDSLALSAARLAVMSEQSEGNGGVGTLSEKLLHKIIKYCIEPDPSMHEIPLLGSIADVKNGEGIFEVQTRSFDRLVPKLSKFLPEHRVTVIYPIVAEKTIRYVDKTDGSVGEPKRSPKHPTVHDAAGEIRKISRFIGNGNLAVVLLFLAAEEYRLLDGWDETRKKGATKLERFPTEVISEICLKNVADYKILLPDSLPEEFSAAEYGRLIKRKGRAGYHPLRLLLDLGILNRERRGRAYIYKRTTL